MRILGLDLHPSIYHITKVYLRAVGCFSCDLIPFSDYIIIICCYGTHCPLSTPLCGFLLQHQVNQIVIICNSVILQIRLHWPSVFHKTKNIVVSRGLP